MRFLMLTVQKKISFLVVAIVFLSTTFSGCNNILNTEPENRIGSTQFFTNEDQVEQAVLGAYSKLQDMYNSHWRFAEQRSDNTIVQFNDANRGQFPTWEIDEFNMTPSNIALEPYWEDIYQGIQRCNAIIGNIDDAQFNTEGLREELMAEAKFLRAFYYFNLVRLFGEVPLVLEEVESPAGAFSTIEERTDVQTVYDQIIMDANDAAGVLPESYSSEKIGRATEGAARTLLADIYLTRQNYSAALGELERVMELGYSLLNNYEAIFDPENKNHPESIFDVNYAELESDLSLGSNFIYQFAPHNSGTQITGDNAGNPLGLNLPTRDILNAYEPGDIRKNASIAYYVDPENSQFGIAAEDTLLYVKMYDHPHSVRGVTNDNWPIYRYAHVLLMMAEVVNELDGPTGQAYSYLNQVRQRAGINALAQGLSQSEFREAVYQEQRVELAFENHRWFNLLRTGRAQEIMQQHAEEVKDIQRHLREPVYVIEEYKLLYPIPARELTLNPDLEQNPGW
jgi:hypothetical protein